MLKNTCARDYSVGVSAAIHWASRENCILGLGLAVSPVGVSTVTSQGAVREPYNKRGPEFTMVIAAGTHGKREPESFWVVELDLYLPTAGCYDLAKS